METILERMRALTDTVLQVRFSDIALERKCCEELLACADTQGSTYAKAFAYTYLGDYYLAMNDSVNAGKYLAQARQFCRVQTYPELYMRVTHLSGFYYHVINDEQNALQYYIEAQTIAKKLGDVYEICNVWNNIADMFERHGNHKQANHYYLQAYNTMREENCTDERLTIMLTYNLAVHCGISGNLPEMERYLSLCEQIVPRNAEEGAFHRIACRSGRCLLEAYRENGVQAVQIADSILENDFYGMQDQYVILEFLTPVGQAMVRLKHSECAQKYIDRLCANCTTNEILPMQHLIELRVCYAQAFSQEDALLESYKNYYFTMKKIQKAEDSVRADGMNAKINLLEMIKQHETTLKENERLTDAANLDELTAIYNRRYFNLRMQQEQAAQSKVGVIMLDIDYFKQFNDTYGHISGDFALREVAVTLKKCAPPNIIPCRYGGDEFVCLCVNAGDAVIQSFIDCVVAHVKSLAIAHETSQCDKIVTLSIGYSNMSKRGCEDTELILKQADKALYQAKENGRACCKKYCTRRSRRP